MLFAGRASAADGLPAGLNARGLRRHLLRTSAGLVLLGLAVAVAPGLGKLRALVEGAHPGWLAVAVLLELLSCLSYVLMFRTVLCARMSWRESYDLSAAQLAVGSLVPSSGVAGLALGAWALRRGGMTAREIGRRTVAFFVLKSAANFVAVAVVGFAIWLGAGPDLPVILTLVPAALAVTAMAGVAALPRLVARHGWTNRAATALGDGVREAGSLLRRREWSAIAGSAGYWAFDNAVLWACLHAFGASPAITLVLMGYLLGQLGGLLPVPGGIGAVDGGLLAALIVYGLPVAVSAAAVLAYRLILFWLPLVLGGSALAHLGGDLQHRRRYEPRGTRAVPGHSRARA